MKKKLLSILIAAITIFTITGCGATADSTAGAGNEANGDSTAVVADGAQKQDETPKVDANADKKVNLTAKHLTCMSELDYFSISKNEKVVVVNSDENEDGITLYARVYDFDNNLLASNEVFYPMNFIWSFNTYPEGKAAIAVSIDGEMVDFYDWDLNKMSTIAVNLPLSDGDYYVVETTDDENVYRIDEKFGQKKLAYVDISKGSTVDYTENELVYDTSKWSYFDKGKNGDYYLVCSVDEEKWGYADKDGNEIAMYSDATDFSADGFAMVSDDRKSYSVIDRDYNVLVKDAVAGKSSYLLGNFFVVTEEDGSKTVYYVSR